MIINIKLDEDKANKLYKELINLENFYLAKLLPTDNRVITEEITNLIVNLEEHLNIKPNESKTN